MYLPYFLYNIQNSNITWKVIETSIDMCFLKYQVFLNKDRLSTAPDLWDLEVVTCKIGLHLLVTSLLKNDFFVCDRTEDLLVTKTAAPAT